MNTEYSAGLMTECSWFIEFKKFLKLKYEGRTEEEIQDLIINHNYLCAPREHRIKRTYMYLLKRTNQLDTQGLQLFFDSDLQTQKLINLICILRQDRLFFEFINEVYREKNILGTEYLENSDGNIFFKNKDIQSDVIASWRDSTKEKLISLYYNIMVDCNLLTLEGKKRKITPPILDVALERYLEFGGETALIKAITGVS